MGIVNVSKRAAGGPSHPHLCSCRNDAWGATRRLFQLLQIKVRQICGRVGGRGHADVVRRLRGRSSRLETGHWHSNHGQSTPVHHQRGRAGRQAGRQASGRGEWGCPSTRRAKDGRRCHKWCHPLAASPAQRQRLASTRAPRFEPSSYDACYGRLLLHLRPCGGARNAPGCHPPKDPNRTSPPYELLAICSRADV